MLKQRIMKKIFIEIDRYDKDHIETMEFLMDRDFKFDEIVEDAYFKGASIIETIESAKEIYADTALIDRSAGFFENMLHFAIERKWTGKKLFIFRSFNSIYFGNLHHTKNLRKVFSKMKNDLYVIEDNEWRKVDVLNEIKEH